MKKILIVAATVFVLAGCYNDKYDKLYPQPVVTCDTSAVSFKNDIMPILNNSCNVAGGCHDIAGQSVSGYEFTTYESFRFQATQDILINDINGTPTNGRHAMPKNLPKMAQCDIDKMTAWVHQGRLDN